MVWGARGGCMVRKWKWSLLAGLGLRAKGLGFRFLGLWGFTV